MDLSKYTEGQRRAITHLDGPLLVCAGAGTGKTFTLTQRIAYALVGDPENGVEPTLDSIDQALVITYTNKAAAELKSRFRNMLRSVGRFDDALKVDSAWVSTIHGMCSRILREHALELGIDPEFKLVMGADQEDALLRAINLAIKTTSANERFQPLFDEYETYAVKNMLKKLMEAAACQTKGLDALATGPEPSPTTRMLYDLRDAAEACAIMSKAKTKEAAELALQKIIDYMEQDGSEKGIPDLIASLGTGRMRGDAAKELKETAALIHDHALINKGHRLLSPLIELARQVESHYQLILRDQCMIDTSNLIRTTLRAFEEHPEIARQYTDRFKLIMVDEFQDTSQLQIDMIERISGAGHTHLCTVGDSQQSIYRFQGADVEVYLKHKQDMARSGALMVELGDNFRSHADILAFVRSICGRPGFFIEDFLDLKAGRKGDSYKGSLPRIELALTMYERGASDKARLTEAEHIATRFRQLIDEGHQPGEMAILMGSTTHMSAYADALRAQGIPSMAAGGSKFYKTRHVKRCISLVKVLANPFDSISMLDVLSSDILPVSSDDLLLISTYYNENSEMLMRQNFAKAFLYSDEAPEGSSQLLVHAMKVLRKAWSDLGSSKPSKVLMNTLIDSGWIDRLQQQGQEGQAVLADILKLVRIIQAKEEDQDLDMASLSIALDAAVESETESTGVLSIEGLQAVRLMTVHGSKGLQFPIVAVTDCYKSRSEGGKLITYADSDTIHASLIPKEKDLKAAVELPEGKQNPAASNDLVEYRAKIDTENTRCSEAERKRLFYVAATRAAEYLIIAMNKQATKSNECKEIEGDLLGALFPGEQFYPDSSGTFEYGGSEPGVFTRYNVQKEEQDEEGAIEAAEGASEGSEGITEDEGRFITIPTALNQRTVALKPEQRRNDFFSYSALPSIYKNAEDGDAHPQKEHATQAIPNAEIPNEEEGAIRASCDHDKATSFGTALHATCEWIALQDEVTESSIKETTRRLACQNLVKNIERLNSAVSNWISSKLCERAYSHEWIQPEVPFCIQVNGRCMEGEIDLLCHNNDGHAFIIDYKTGGHADESEAILQAKHRLQAECYAYAALASGFESVELHFARVEQLAEDGNMQVVSYRYEKTDIENLKQAIEGALEAM